MTRQKPYAKLRNGSRKNWRRSSNYTRPVLLIEGENTGTLSQKFVYTAAAIMQSDLASLPVLYPERASGGELRFSVPPRIQPKAAAFWAGALWVGSLMRGGCAILNRLTL